MQRVGYGWSERKRLQEGGFTLIELMVVIGIIAILISFVMPKFSTASEKAKKVKEEADIKTIQNAAELYLVEHEGTDQAVTVDTLVKEGYLRESDNTKDRLENHYEIHMHDNGQVQVTKKISGNS